VKSVLVVGTGRLAHALIHRLVQDKDVRLSVAGRSEERRTLLSVRYGIDAYSFENYREAQPDVFLLAVRDDVVESVAARLDSRGAVVFHHAGSLPLKAVSRFHDHAGVMYPLQTFAMPESVCWEEIPLLTQVTSDKAAEALSFLASKLGGLVRPSSDLERERLHLCAVWVNNFSRLMLAEAEALCKAWQLPFELLEPLTRSTFLSPPLHHPQGQMITGPAARGDEGTISKQLELLTPFPHARHLYKTLTDHIKNLKKVQ
jgi:predicted short-subunit dehydrogenase-like oxidoreductase (DUF2520 family)